MAKPPEILRAPQTPTRTSLEARLLLERLRQMAVGDCISYAELSAIAGCDVQVRRRPLETARRLACTLYRLVFDVDRDVGLVCLSEPGKVAHAENRTQAQHRAAVRTMAVLAAVDVPALSPEQRYEHHAQLSIVGFMRLVSHRTNVERLNSGETLPALPPFDREAHARLSQLWAPQR